MNKKITVEQSHAVMSVLVQNVKWDELDMGNLQESVIRNPIGAGAQFTLFLKNGARVSIDGLKISTAPFGPVEFLGAGWKIVADEHDNRNDGLTEVDFNKVDFVGCLTKSETSITGEEKLKRLKAGKQIRYGVTTFVGLWNDYQSRKENSVLETLFLTKGITYLDFFGDVLLDLDDDRNVLCFYRLGDGQWNWDYDWLDNGWGARHWSAVSSQVSA